MKNLYIIFLIILSSFTSNAMEEKRINLEIEIEEALDPGYAALVYEKLVVARRLPESANRYLDRVAKTRSDVPQHIWANIKQELDYSKFKRSVINILKTNYTSNELWGMLIQNTHRDNIPLTLELRNEIQLVAEDFSSDLLNQTNTILQSNGYSPIVP